MVNFRNMQPQLPEYFKSTGTGILAGFNGVVCMVDDILIHGKNQAEHDQRLRSL